MAVRVWREKLILGFLCTMIVN